MNSNRPKPRPTYLAQSDTLPSQYETNPPPKLLVLGTGGILVHRQRPLPGNFKNRTRPIVERPYLFSFLAYCLGAQTSCFDKTVTPNDVDKAGPFSGRPYGKQFWTETRMKDKEEFFQVEAEDEETKKKEEIPLPQIINAPYHLLIWTAAQVHNVNSNLTSIFGNAYEPRERSKASSSSPLQPLSSHLLRVYDRKTLQPEGTASYKFKTPSWKDLEILWRPLNTGDESLLDAGKRFAKEKSRGGRLEECVQVPFGPHNTLQVIDDAADIHAQPFNVLLVPEFDEQAANLASKYRKSHPQTEGQKGSTSEFNDENNDKGDPEGLEAQDDVLLQLIAILEEARYQKNVSAWIKSGGLGEFGVSENSKQNERIESVGKGKTCEEWAQEGKEVLRTKGIAIQF